MFVFAPSRLTNFTNTRKAWSPCLLIALAASAAQSQPTSIAYSDYTSQAGLDDAVRSIAPNGRYGIMAGGGVAGDFNNDGFHDIFMLGGGNFPDYLYINNQDGTFTNHATDMGVDLMHHSFGASAADFNNDGYLDLFITSYGPADQPVAAGMMRLFQNNGPDQNGQWSFTDVAPQAGVNVLIGTVKDGLGSAWGDYDLDGDLDLFICGYSESRKCNRLFRNNGPDQNGQWTFTDTTIEAGLERNDVFGFLPQFVDMNGDLYPELILIADAGTSKYFVNNGDGTFTDQTADARGIETANGMGVDIGDVNNDGLLDMYVTSITYESTDGPGNVLLIQNQDQTYDNLAHETGSHSGYWGWGTLINDFDHDGDRDIAETNGFLGSFAGNPAVMFDNLGDGTAFNEVAVESGFIHTQQGRGMVRLDIENDGDLDIIIFNNNAQIDLLRNELITTDTPADRNWIRIQLETAARDSLAPHGIGAMVKVYAGEQYHLLPMHSGSSHASASPIEVHAGLASATTIDTLRIEWPDGSFTTQVAVPTNQSMSISAPFHPADYTDDQAVNVSDIFAFLANYTKNSLVADHNGDMTLNFFDVSAFIADYRNAMIP